MRPRQLFTAVARAEGVTWAALIAGMVLKHLTRTTDVVVTVAGLAHGVVFLSYVLTVLAIAVNHRWRLDLLGQALAAGVVPFATVWFERWARRRGHLSGDWRLGRNQSIPHTPAERVLAWCLRRPGLAVLLAAGVVVATTALLLSLGPPWEWGPIERWAQVAR